MRNTAIAAFVLILILLAAAACSGTKGGSGSTGSSATTGHPGGGDKTETGTETQQQPTAAETNLFGWEKPAETTVIHYYEKGNDNPERVAQATEAMSRYVLDEFNVELKKIVYNVDGSEKLNLMLASGDYPEVIVGMSAEDVSRWAAQGKLLELTPLIGQHGPDIQKELGSLYNLYMNDEQQIWGLPNMWGYLPIPALTAHIRLDHYEELGSPPIETPDDFYEVMKQIVANHPTDANGGKTYALSWNQITNIDDNTGFWGLKKGYKEGADQQLTHWLNTEEGLEYVLFYNRFFREGLMDPDSFLNKYVDFQQKVTNQSVLGYIGTWSHTWGAGHETWIKTVPDYKENMRFINIAFKAPEAEQAYLTGINALGGSYTVLTDKAKSPEAIMKFLNFNMTPMGTRLMGWGVPNGPDSVWTYNGGSDWSFVEEKKQQLLAGTLDWDRFDRNGHRAHWLVVKTGLMSDDEKSTAWYDQNFNQEDQWKKRLNDNMRDTLYDYTPYAVTFARDNPLTLVNQQIKELVDSGFVKAVTSRTEEESKAAFYELRDRANALGLRDIEQFRSEEYRKKLQAMR